MEKVLLIGCKKYMDKACVACSRCMVAFNRKEGEFERYKEEGAELIGLLNCGDCPGVAVVPRMAQLKFWNKGVDEKITKLHIASCVDACPYKETLTEKIKLKAGVEVIEGSHPYIPKDIFS